MDLFPLLAETAGLHHTPRMKTLPFALALFAALSAPAFAQKSADNKKPVAATPAPKSKSRVQDVLPDDAEKLIAARKDIVVVDVRTVEEYDTAHIPGAVNISVIDEDFDAKLKEIEGKPVLVHCAAGVRSLRAVARMNATGKFPEIFHLSSGFAAWQEAGKTVVKSPKPQK